ncbi:type III secretion system outer membrane ring subunit SctC [Caulobacter hibisci]|uniref:Type 3 secretion system secretin n=1 Tax=Caulobacter hibisci TaxID=2035993 RepID=A0ABS0SSV0_9CAUL|nr:type III secretion system outer membrane ring subunit SctC [Caulobacter hibisci]MBI1682722.1 type III secretion system outer membrane ring subunit SctC [Caulobacter hibisci]
MSLSKDSACVRRRPARRGVAAAVAAAVLAVAAPQVQAGEVPFGGRSVDLTAREQPIAQFLQNFYNQVGVPVIVSSQVAGTINGVFRGPAAKIDADIAKAFDLVTYYDGGAAYVYTAAQLSSRSFPISGSASRRVDRAARQLDLLDGRNTLRPTGDMLVATGAPRFLQQVDELARGGAQAEAASPTLQYRVFYLRYGWADDVNLTVGAKQVTIPGVASIIRSLVSTDPNERVGAVARSETPVPPAVQGLRGQGLATLGTPNPGGSFYGGQDGQGTLGTPLANEQTGVYVPPNPVRIQADSRLNAVIVRDVAERMSAYEELVRALDVEPQLLEVEAAIIDIDTTKARDLGINWRFDDGNGGVQFGRGPNAPSGLEDTNLTRGNTSPKPYLGLVASTIIGNGDYFAARLNALETEGVARVVSRPQIVTLSNVEAVFENSRDFYVRLAGERDVDLFNVTAGTTLRVTPHVTRDGNQTRIRMLVSIEDGSLTNASVDNIPVVRRAALNTQALIVEGQSLLLGGMTVQSDTTGSSKVPVLGSIPVLGNLFKVQQRSSGRIERMFLITPRLASIGAARSTTQAGLRYDAPASGFENAPLPAAPKLPADRKPPPRSAPRAPAQPLTPPPPPPPVADGTMKPIPNPS